MARESSWVAWGHGQGRAWVMGGGVARETPVWRGRGQVTSWVKDGGVASKAPGNKWGSGEGKLWADLQSGWCKQACPAEDAGNMEKPRLLGVFSSCPNLKDFISSLVVNSNFPRGGRFSRHNFSFMATFTEITETATSADELGVEKGVRNRSGMLGVMHNRRIGR